MIIRLKKYIEGLIEESKKHSEMNYIEQIKVACTSEQRAYKKVLDFIDELDNEK